MKIRNAREAIRTKYAIRTKGDIEKAKEWAERCSNADWLKVMEMARQLIGPCYHAYTMRTMGTSLHETTGRTLSNSRISSLK